MRIALIADTHMPRGRRALPEQCLERLREADLIVHLGDFSELAVVEQLEALGPPVRGVHGNVDSSEVRARMPERDEVELDGARLGLVHDAGPARGRLGRLREAFPGCDAVLFGHSHLPLHERDGGFQIFNPGSPTERRRAPRRSMGEAEVRAGRVALRHVWLG